LKTRWYSRRGRFRRRAPCIAGSGLRGHEAVRETLRTAAFEAGPDALADGLDTGLGPRGLPLPGARARAGEAELLVLADGRVAGLAELRAAAPEEPVPAQDRSA
jgi:hypothetical protein